MSDVTLRRGDALDLVKGIATETIDAVVTSSPYDALRVYGRQAWDFEGIALELYRVLKQGGVLVWVVNDETVNGSESVTSAKQKIFFREQCGFNIHDTMIYEKAAWLAFDDKYNQAFEYMFVLSKGKPKTAHLIRDRKNMFAGRRNSESRRQADGSRTMKRAYVQKLFGTRSNIWRFANGYNLSTTDREAFEHPAMFPEALARDHILTWTNAGDTVLDCFMGSGTTGKLCVRLNRNFVGFEIHAPYFEIAARRIETAQMQLPLPMEMKRKPEAYLVESGIRKAGQVTSWWERELEVAFSEWMKV